MSFLFGGAKPQPSSAEKIAAAETEIEMVGDMFSRLTQSCIKKCIPTDYREGELNKGESVCLDRCVGKFFEANMKVSEKMQTDAAGRQNGGMGFDPTSVKALYDIAFNRFKRRKQMGRIAS